MRLNRAVAVLLLFAPLAVPAQTYTPKEIRLEGVAATDAPDLLRVANLKPGTSMTVAEIEAALQRLGDTGMFSDIRYSVNDTALVFKLTLAASAQSLPARYANFLWWQPAELEQLVEARVPVFHGSLPATGNLTDQVKAALVALLKEKGIDATVTAVESGSAIALSITQPEILPGTIRLQDELPALKAQLDERVRTLDTEDFDRSGTTTAIKENVADVYRNAGYLDVATDTPTYSLPRKDPTADRFLIDATTTVHAGEIYRIARIDYPSTLPVSAADIGKAANLKVGAPASASDLRLAQAEIGKAFFDHGYLEARATADTAQDRSAHTTAYSFTILPGEIYHLEALYTSALTPAQQGAFANDVHLETGAVVDLALRQDVQRGIQDLHLPHAARLVMTTDRTHHTATISIKP